MPFDADPAATHNPTLDDIVPVNWLDLINANFAYLGAAWTAFTPAMTFSGGGSLTIGNGTITGAYRLVGKTLDVNIDLRIGSTTTFGTSDWRFTLPASLTSAARRQTGKAFGDDTGTAYREGVAVIDSSVTYIKVVPDGGSNPWSTNVPHVWANGDALAITCSSIEVA